MAVALPPTLHGKILTLRPITLADFEELYGAASDPEIWDQHPFPRFERAAFAEFFDQAVDSKSGLVALDQKTNKIIGASRYYDFQVNKVSIGYTFLARSHWGRGFNRDLKTLMLDHAFKFVSEVFFDVGENNIRSRRAMGKIGAKFVRFQMNDGKPYTLYKINEREFRAALNESLP